MSKQINDAICGEMLAMKKIFIKQIILFIYLNISPVDWDSISYWCSTNPFIHISINLIENSWITHVYNKFFWLYIGKM